MPATLILAVLAAACGSESPAPAEESVPAAASETEVESAVVRAGDVFTLDSFATAGWKKSKEYSTETLPGATEVWYGFYNQKDIEIRFYPDHQTAVAQGGPSATEAVETAVKRSRGGLLLDFSGGSFTGRGAHVIAGNAVLMCELELATCEVLLDRL